MIGDPAGSSTAVRDGDLRGLLRLAAEAGELPADAIVRREYALRALCRLIGADSGLFLEVGDNSLGGYAIQGSVLTVNMDERESRIIQEYKYTGAPLDPAVPTLLSLPQATASCFRAQLVDDGAWYRSSHFNEVRRIALVDDQLYCRLVLPDGRPAGVALNRTLGSTPFGIREATLMSIFHTEAARVYLPPRQLPTPPPADRPALLNDDPRLVGLPPRLRMVLSHLLMGDGEKQVALKLGISRHTVHGYAKELYRRLQVTSRAELLARFVAKESIAIE